MSFIVDGIHELTGAGRRSRKRDKEFQKGIEEHNLIPAEQAAAELKAKQEQGRFMRAQEESAKIAREMLEETRAANQARLAEVKAERDRIVEEGRIAKEKDAASEAEAKKKLKSRGRRRLALIKSGDQGEGTLGNISVGRRKVLGN